VFIVQEFHGRAIAVAFKGPRGSQINSVSKLFVGNLPWTMDVLELKEKAGEFGEVRSANVSLHCDIVIENHVTSPCRS
jgi:hypothetical protein